MHVLIAPDKFKGSMSAREAAAAMARGTRRVWPEATITQRPLADGGEGTIDALLASVGGEITSVAVAGPLGESVMAPLARLHDGRLAFEVAAASGLVLVDEQRRDALRATSLGAGELARAALDRGARALLVCVGGTASTDGGTGAAGALGWRFLDRRGRPLGPGGGDLSDLHRIDPDGVDARLRAATVVAACDVGNPLLGPDGAARAFGPQKGATPHDVERLEEGLATLAQRIGADLGVEVAARWGAGAGGGLGAGLLAFFGADLCPGFDVVADAARLESDLVAADLALTGEGRLDDQSARGKAPVGLARRAQAAGVRCLVVAGAVDLAPEDLAASGFAAAASLTDEVGRERALGDPAAALAEATARMLRRAAPG